MNLDLDPNTLWRSEVVTVLAGVPAGNDWCPGPAVFRSMQNFHDALQN